MASKKHVNDGDAVSTDAVAPEPPAFEQSLNELESLVGRLEAGELSLEESLQTFERGVQLSRLCQRALDAAEQRVELLQGTGAEDTDNQS